MPNRQTGIPIARTIRSIQAGTVTNSANSATQTATITSVNTNKAAVFMNGMSVGNTSSFAAGTRAVNDHFARVSLTNATTVTLTFAAAVNNSSDIVAAFTVIEYW